MTIELAEEDIIIAAVVVWFVGTLITRHVGILRRYSIPVAVTGGLLFSSISAILHVYFDVTVELDLELRDTLLLAFFSTIGLTAKARVLLAGGRALAVVVVVAAVLLFIQNSVGLGLAILFDEHPGYGLFGGSVSLAGGHGTAIAWGTIAEDLGLSGAKDVGLAFATFGLVAGGIFGGPVAEYLIRRHNLQPNQVTAQPHADASAQHEEEPRGPRVADVLGTLMLIALCVKFGDIINTVFSSNDITVPGFLTAMMTGIVIGNLTDTFRIELSDNAIKYVGEISLHLFLAISLMSVQLWTIAAALAPILAVMAVQILGITLLSIFVVFRVLGRDYDAAIICAGFTGLGLGATPVGIANMTAVTRKYGPSTKAFLVVPLVGAFFIDIVNAAMIQFFASLPIIQNTPLPN